MPKKSLIRQLSPGDAAFLKFRKELKWKDFPFEFRSNTNLVEGNELHKEWFFVFHAAQSHCTKKMMAWLNWALDTPHPGRVGGLALASFFSIPGATNNQAFRVTNSIA